jgi:hypothetical protein
VRRGKHPTFNIEHPTPNVPAMSERQPLDVERWMLVVGCFHGSCRVEARRLNYFTRKVA